jgi:hypothetical protein
VREVVFGYVNWSGTEILGAFCCSASMGIALLWFLVFLPLLASRKSRHPVKYKKDDPP